MLSKVFMVCMCVYVEGGCVCICRLLNHLLAGPTTILNGVIPMEKCNQVFFHFNLRKLFFCLLAYLKLIVMKTKQESDEVLLTVTTGV